MFKDFQEIQYALLITLEDFKITIISIFRDTDKSYNAFVKVSNKVSLFNIFTLPEESYIDYQNDILFNENFGVKRTHKAKPKLRGLKKVQKPQKTKIPSTDRYEIDDTDERYKDLI